MADLPPYPNRNTDMESDRGSPPSTPRWVKVFAIIAIILILLFVILQFTGDDHGPRRHLPTDNNFGDRTSYSIVIEDYTLSNIDLADYTLPSHFTKHEVLQL